MSQATPEAGDSGAQVEEQTSLTFATLPSKFYARLAPQKFAAIEMFVLNAALSRALGLEPSFLHSEDGLAILSGGATLHGGDAIAMAYAGHQFGHYSPLLGDGRARLVGETLDVDGVRHDIHLKGSGLTPFSRGGDGRATLGSCVREYVVSEAMGGLKVPTTRSLAIVTTGEQVERQKSHPGAVLVRTAKGHLRVGTFQYGAALGDLDHLKALADYAIARLFPELAEKGTDRFGAFLKAVALRQADLISRWLGAGFIHGVMNTDNMSIAGETIDYGPCAFIDAFHPGKVFSSIDQFGRYAWNKQPEIGHWNLVRLAEAILPLLGKTDEARGAAAKEALQAYMDQFDRSFCNIMAQKLGVEPGHHDFSAFLSETFHMMSELAVDFTIFFNALTRHVDSKSEEVFGEDERSHPAAEKWFDCWQKMRADSPVSVNVMRSVNPVRIARNHQVEKAIQDAENGSAQSMNDLVEALLDPCKEDSRFDFYEGGPRKEEIVHQTFCGT